MDTLRRRARSLRRAPTDAEALLWRNLRRSRLAGLRFRRQHPVAGYILDLACPAIGLAIELDGGQHVDSVAYEERRSTLLAAAGWRVLRFWSDDVVLRTEEVLAEVLRVIESIGVPRDPPATSEDESTKGAQLSRAAARRPPCSGCPACRAPRRRSAAGAPSPGR